MCGRIVGYQYNSPDAVHNYLWSKPWPTGAGIDPSHDDINSHYVDGVSITHGFPRKHIWTFMGGLLDVTYSSYYNCPCTSGSDQIAQSFVGI